MFNNKEKLKIIIFVLIAAIGFATGINYRANVSNSSIAAIKGCLEFGIYPFIEGRKNIDIIIGVVVSSIKHYILFVSGVFLWAMFPIVPINLFCLSFKMGVCASYVFSVLGFKGLFGNFIFFVLCLFIILVAIAFSYTIFNKRLNHVIKNKVSSYEIMFLKNSIFALIGFVGIVIMYLLLFKTTGTALYGILNTYL